MAGSSSKGHDFLRAIAAFGEANAPVSSARKPIKLGRVDYEYAPGDFLGGIMPRVLFDGEKTVSQKRYQVMSGYYPQPGQRVVLVPVGTTYMIIGSVDPTQQDPKIQYFTTPGANTWDKWPGARLLRVQVQAGGGAGGGVVASAASAVAAGGGGAGGGYGESWISANGVTDSVTITVGAGGAGNTGQGDTGGTSSFGSYVSASGGFGGGSTGTGTTNAGQSGAPSDTQVIVADLAIAGGGGGAAMRVPTGVTMGGVGGSSQLGTGGRGSSAAGALVPGTNGGGYGGGGGGACSGTTNNAAANGGNGSPGIVIVTTYF